MPAGEEEGPEPVDPARGPDDDGLGDGQVHAAELGIEGRERGDPVELLPQERRTGRRTEAAGDVGHDLDEVTEEEFPVLMRLRDVGEQGIALNPGNPPAQGEADHEGGGGLLSERVRDSREDQGDSRDWRGNPFWFSGL